MRRLQVARSSREPQWDAIVIGAGLGGLTTAAYLTTNGVRTLVLEQYDVAGGCSHVFRRKRQFEFDVGVHYLGDCQPGGAIPSILRGVGLDGKIEFLEMDADGFDTLVFPDFTFRVPCGWDRYLERLIDAFPEEEAGLRKCVGILAKVGHELERTDRPTTTVSLLPFGMKARTAARWSFRSVAELYSFCALGPGPRAVISAQSLDHSAPPSRAAISMHAGLLHHYINGGAYYPRGGGQVLAAHLIDVISSHGGQVRTGTRVERITIDAGRVTGVTLRDGESLAVPVVVSNADIKRTYLELIGQEHVRAKAIARTERYRMALPLHCVYLALDIDLADRLPNTNYWCHPNLDTEAQYQYCYAGDLPDQLFAYITSASVKDPFSSHIAPPGQSTLEIMTVVPPHYRFWNVTQGPATGERYRRKPDYRSIKNEITDRLIERASEVIPGLEEHIVWKEGATPMTQERYTLSSGGACYGLEHAPDQIGPRRPGPRTSIRGLYLTGHSTPWGHGVVGVMTGGVGAASAVLGRNLRAQIRSGRVFGDPSRLSAGGPGWDALEASRRLPKNRAHTDREAALRQ